MSFDDRKVNDLRNATRAMLDWSASQDLEPADLAMVCLMAIGGIIASKGPAKLDEGLELAHRSLDVVTRAMGETARTQGLYDAARRPN